MSSRKLLAHQPLPLSFALLPLFTPPPSLCSFLGAGKTVLLNHLLANPNGRRICVIENEAGAVSIDHALVKQQQQQSATDVVVLKNGCMCCTATGPGGELERTLDRLLQLRNDAKATAASSASSASSSSSPSSSSTALPFDHLVIELSGLADPSSIVETFLRPEMTEKYCLDGVVAVVDAKHLATFHLDDDGANDGGSAGRSFFSLSRESEAARQLTFADIVLLNKTDIASRSQIEKATKAIQQINPSAVIKQTSYCAIESADTVLALRSYDLGRASSMSLQSMRQLVEAAKAKAKASGASSRPHHSAASASATTRAITLIQPADTTLSLAGFTSWLQRSVVQRHYKDLYRVKGILWVRPPSASSSSSSSAFPFVAEDEDESAEEEPPLPFVVHGVHSDIQGAFDEDLALKAAKAANATGAASSSSFARLHAEQTVFSPALILIGKGSLLQDESKLREEFDELLEELEADERAIQRHAQTKAKVKGRKKKQDECDCGGHDHQHGHSHSHAAAPAPPSSVSRRRRSNSSGGKK